jgi:hypothetical protein
VPRRGASGDVFSLNKGLGQTDCVESDERNSAVPEDHDRNQKHEAACHFPFPSFHAQTLGVGMNEVYRRAALLDRKLVVQRLRFLKSAGK